ncbi:hypothetical protein RvY_02645 [Ramazzottius varieornatus]|uniref:Reverse transcriptase domain-containing protein n=1 Tax=Ramazzottius varieornatus TaxID=947166 RepID=A0A1D1UV04_RAMVA|nr:hypothetical protein RvY_02645 [Ramazzottius varieornatus]
MCRVPRVFLKLFADDIVLYRVIQALSDETELQKDLDSIFEWSKNTKLTFKALKSVFVRLSEKRTVLEPPAYHLGSDALLRSNTVKYLGVQMDHRLSWKDHVSSVAVKAKKRVRYISSLFNRKCQRARITHFQSLVLPLLTYCSVVCSPRQKGLIDDPEDCQRKFLRTINFGLAMEDSSIERYCSRLQQRRMELLILKRIKDSLVLAYKMVSRNVPVGDFFFEPFVSVAAPRSVAGNTRRTGMIRSHPFPLQLNASLDRRNIRASDSSFAYLVSRIWNDVVLNAKAYTSPTKFSQAVDCANWRSVLVLELLGPYAAFLPLNH